MEPRDVINAIGCRDLRKERTQQKLAKFILDTLGLDRKQLEEGESYMLCAE